MTDRWNEVFENDELAKQIISLQPADAQKVLAENGFDFTIDEILAKGEELNEFIKKMNSGEISEETLDEVSGGCKWCFATGVALGVVAYMLPW